MTVKLVVLYPRPTDVDEFERRYVGEHLPLMRKLVGPDVPLPTYRTRAGPEAPAPYYRVAEIHFQDEAHLLGFVRSEAAEIGRASSVGLSTGGPPVFLVCDAQPEI